MDIAALLGFIGAVGMILAAMIAGGGIAPFVDNQSVLIVFGGSFFAVMYSVPMPTFLAHFKAMGKCFKPGMPKLDETVERMVELAGMARKDGMMALEGQPVPDKFFEKGMQMLVDGADEQKLIKQMNSEIASMKSRHAATAGCVNSWVDLAPAMGMIGTLIGLVQMLANLKDPNAIGPAMAVALLTTFYGAVMAYMVFAPVAAKIDRNAADERQIQQIYMVAASSIARQENPRQLEMLLNTILPPSQRLDYYS